MLKSESTVSDSRNYQYVYITTNNELYVCTACTFVETKTTKVFTSGG